jgi:hypothetical protein
MEKNDLKIEKESNVRKNILIVLLSLIIIGLVGWIVYDKFVTSHNEELDVLDNEISKTKKDINENSNNDKMVVEEVLNNVGQVIYKDAKIMDELIEFTPIMSKENFNENYKKDNATCGLNNMEDDNGHKLECGYMGTDNIVAYVQNKIAYVGVPDTFGNEGGSSEETGENFLLFTLNNIKNASSVNMDFNQYYNGIAYISTTEGDLYYFILLDSETFSLYKVNIKNKFVKFVKNEEHSIGSSYGTRTIFELSNGIRYTINYNYNEKNISLEKID